MAKKKPKPVDTNLDPPKGSSGQTAMKVIVAGGVFTFVLLLLTAQVLKQSLKPNEEQRAEVGRMASPFDGQRAYDDLKKIIAIGPRVAGSQQAAATREYIQGALRSAGLEIVEQAFDASTPIGVRKMVNLTGIVHGSKPGIIVIGEHYDTKYFPEFTFVGANDGGSTTAWMIELARALGPSRTGMSVWLAFFDGEEAFKEWSDTDSLYGSREYVLRAEGIEETRRREGDVEHRHDRRLLSGD